MAPPPLRSALGMGLRAAAGEAWLLPVGALVTALRSVATLPALVVGAGLVLRGAERAARLHPGSLGAPLEGAAAVLVSPRFHALVAGTWFAGALLSALLRAVFLSGALPTLAARMAGGDPTRRFAPGVAWGLPRLLSTWLLAGCAELAAAGYLLAVAIAAARIAVAPRDGSPLPPSVVGGLALTVGVGGLLVARVLGEAAAARTAILGEGPARAFGEATRRLLARPGAFLLGGIAAALAGVAAWWLLQPLAGVVAVVRERLDGSIAIGPELMLALLAVLGATAVDLAWLAAVGSLACAEAPAGAEGSRPLSA